MKISHAAIVLATTGEGGDHRPFLVVQSDLYNETHNTITVCPMTSVVGGEALFRVAFSPREHTGLTVECEVQVDKILSIPRNHIVKLLGHASPTRMEQVDQALRRWLML
ncbi:mRNA interferase MazF [Sphingomonas sp. SORGH_AS 950]|uniref:type II toxin-antitoxin system PemK/MazF family toxin n=1 Tax=unclassified Sphingomonas TaxID=196159 RepID=UPI0021BB0A1A|nr:MULTISPECIES: type II toxin-antitoxin system PemK/MazF family toxin [unclassified Sphingomonas]MCT8000703.1 type II toxin-antitoxin system PemK/MazF family toxin [Sphingomonas sp. LC-1]MDQ1156709.1 mRNA interferase MazF [Sphingomonas sp. SORGH_AS_0950]MDR6147101.1 mRNA interferase MazF [Sphingomonas sp. SORGH_AS_0870]